MSDVATVWTVLGITASVVLLLAWLMVGDRIRHWWQRTQRCPKGRHAWIYSGEAMAVATRRFCPACTADDPTYRDRTASAEGPQTVVKVGDAAMVRVSGVWGDPVGYDDAT